MNKKELISPVSIVLLSMLFIVICCMVYISGGKSKKWLARKMKIGGILLSITAITAGTGCPTCYDMPAPEYVTFKGSEGYSIEIDLDTGNLLSGTLMRPEQMNFSFAIIDTLGQLKQKDLIKPVDGEFGELEEAFNILIDSTLSSGYYQLNIFDCDTAQQQVNYHLQNFSLKIKNE